jgi:5-(carboxyamino)imidazole ribonucleotide mutase
MVASMTEIPVLGVPIKSKALDGLDSLLSIMQMPAGIPVGTLAIGEAGAKNSALLAIAILAINDKKLEKKLIEFRKKQTETVALKP